MPEEYTNRELGILIESLTEKIEDGFKGVHDRQDTTNGKVLKSCKDIEILYTWKNILSGSLLIINIVILPIVLFMIFKYLG
jgi:hypothetical protein